MGFCRSIDSGIHGKIHGLVGTAKNMGKIPYAARDPLFWVHHVQIDRLWASWNANYGGLNPTTGTWLNAPFTFSDRFGQAVTGRLKDFFSTATLGYGYDALYAPPPPPAPKKGGKRNSSTLAAASSTTQRLASLMVSEPERVASSTTMASMGTTATSFPLKRLASAKQIAPVLGLAPDTSTQRTYLVLTNLHTWKQPEVLYHVYLTPVRGGAINKNTYAGTINFFDAEFHDHGAGSKLDTALGPNFYSFDVTELVRRFERSGAVSRDEMKVTFVPGGKARADAGAMVATVELVRQ
jgi:hypothetical protein